MKHVGEKDTYRLHGQADAAWALLETESECRCTTGVEAAVDKDGDPLYDSHGRQVFVPVKACKTRLDHALRVARQAAGFSHAANGGGRNTDTPNPVLAAVQALELVDYSRHGKHKGWKRHVAPEWWQERIQRNTALIAGALADLVVIVSELGKITTTDPKDLGKNGQGTCPCCDTFCSGAVNDRLVAGMCFTDYRAWDRAGRPERYYWIRDRRAYYTEQQVVNQ